MAAQSVETSRHVKRLVILSVESVDDEFDRWRDWRRL